MCGAWNTGRLKAPQGIPLGGQGIERSEKEIKKQWRPTHCKDVLPGTPRKGLFLCGGERGEVGAIGGMLGSVP